MIGDKRILAAGTAMFLAGGYSSLVLAQTPAGQPSTAPAGQPAAPGAERQGVALSTDAADLFARDRNVAVSQRPREGYEARGLRMGAFLAYPKLSVSAEANDNIYATDLNEVDDMIWRITPEVNLNSDWSRHALGAYARAVLARYQDNDNENTTDYALGVNGRLDLLRFTNIRGSFDWGDLTEPRTSPDSPGTAAEPVKYNLSTLNLIGEHTVNRLRFMGRYQYQRFDYESPDRIGGGIVEQSYRDRDINLFLGRVDYAVSPATAVFFEVTGNNRNYDLPGVGGALNRDSDGIQFLAGANFELGAVARGEVGVGYLEQEFDDPALEKIDGFGARAQVEWFPTQLTTVTFNGSRTVEDSATGGTGAYLSSNVGVTVDHELMRNVILTARAAYGEDEYDEIGRKDERQNAGLSATYLLNRSIGLKASWAYDRRDTVKGAGDSFKQNIFAATITAQF
ncbi:outer membrane beta-barrel protein [Phenylobacterium sp. J367]|uniref:outer membrane beta-barrel protein n=1 Tax=Phenylobacterium sp. J367 TaxID=2898435 RepID=UPI00215188CB|nr:outer membrane beta-barrel protein [Phenylobacterium sp. J367]MCR5879514.1 outer membrane beta-barrel protein [Phenylobacterium sp. J367]